MIVVIPTGGLANRMRAVDSARALSRKMKCALQVVWVTNKSMICGFRDLFKEIQGVEVIESNKIPFKYAYRDKVFHFPRLLRKLFGITLYKQWAVDDLLQENVNFEQLVSSNKTIVFESYTRFYPNEKQYSDFEPLDVLKSKIEKETSDFNEFTIGVHIRRTDNEKAVENSPLDLFAEAVQKEINVDDRHNFYLATDDQEVKKAMMQAFGDRIRTNSNRASRKKCEDVQQGLVELFALSNTKKVYGSYWSSFSHAACDLTGIEEITVRKK